MRTQRIREVVQVADLVLAQAHDDVARAQPRIGSRTAEDGDRPEGYRAQPRYESTDPLDQYILAAGSWTPPLTRKLKLNVPIQAGKGYALIIDPFDPMPTVPMLLVNTSS